MLLSDIPCVTSPAITDTTTGIAIPTNSISSSSINSIILGEDSCVTHTTIFMNDYSCTSMIKTVTVMPSCVLTEQVSSDTQTG